MDYLAVKKEDKRKSSKAEKSSKSDRSGSQLEEDTSNQICKTDLFSVQTHWNSTYLYYSFVLTLCHRFVRIQDIKNQCTLNTEQCGSMFHQISCIGPKCFSVLIIGINAQHLITHVHWYALISIQHWCPLYWIHFWLPRTILINVLTLAGAISFICVWERVKWTSLLLLFSSLQNYDHLHLMFVGIFLNRNAICEANVN